MSILLSFWYAGLFVVGQGANEPQLLVWALGLMALLSLLFGLTAPDFSPTSRHVLSFLIGAASTAIGILAGVVHSPAWKAPWLSFCTLLGSVWYLGVIVAELIWSPRDRGTMAPADAGPHRVRVPMVEPGSDEYRAARDEERIDRGLPVRPLA